LAALAFAVAAAAALNAVLWNLGLVRLIYPRAAYNLLGLSGKWPGAYRWVTGPGPTGDKRRPLGRLAERFFEENLEDYLKGNWFEAERKLNVLMRRDEHDLEARLLMATLLRHTKRFDDATHQLNLLVRLEGAHRGPRRSTARRVAHGGPQAYHYIREFGA